MVIETGLWLLIAVAATAFTFLSLKTVDRASMGFHMLAVALWMILAVMHASGLEVAATSNNLTYNGTNYLIFNETKTDVFIPGGTEANWLSILFLGFAIFNVLMVFKQVVRV